MRLFSAESGAYRHRCRIEWVPNRLDYFSGKLQAIIVAGEWPSYGRSCQSGPWLASPPAALSAWVLLFLSQFMDAANLLSWISRSGQWHGRSELWTLTWHIAPSRIG